MQTEETLFRNLAAGNLTFCNDTPSVATNPKLKNLQDLDLESLAACFSVRCLSNRKLFQHNEVQAHCSYHSPAHEFTRVRWTGKLAAKYSGYKWCRLLFSLRSLQQTVYHHKISDIDQLKVETYANRLLGSAKPGRIEPRYRSAAKQTDNSYESKQCPCWILSGLTVCANNRCFFTVSWVQIEQNPRVLVKCSIISNCKLGKEYLNTMTCNFCSLFLDKIWNLLRYYILTVAKLSKQFVFGPLCTW